jgi:hypothetical protein
VPHELGTLKSGEEPPRFCSLPSQLMVLSGRLPDAPVSPESLGFAPAEWARESCSIVSRSDFYPPRVLTEDYLRVFQPIVRQRLYQAGERLARTLNTAFGSPASK